MLIFSLEVFVVIASISWTAIADPVWNRESEAL
jgi:hypothetical protein